MGDAMGDSAIGALISRYNNWGRWGDDDELGTLNFVTNDVVRRGAAAILSGERITCGRVLSPSNGEDNPNPVLHHMTQSGEAAEATGMSSSSDWLGVECHGFAVSHLDAPCHLFWDGYMYNGHPAGSVHTRIGATRGSVDVAKLGIISRGVLFDVPSFRADEWLEPGQVIEPEDLELFETESGVRVSSGDVLLVRTGRDARFAAKGRGSFINDGFAGLSGDCVAWLAEREVSALGGDGANDVVIPGRENKMPVHAAGIVGLGLWLLDNLNLESLATACLNRQTYDFQFCVAPLRIKNGTGSPVNPIAIV